MSTQSQPAIRLQKVSKRFAFTPDTPQSVLESLIAFATRRRAKTQDLWAVRDVTFTIATGQCVGIIGRNGSGKSSLLKLVARIIQPTTGQIEVRGRVSALLELGAGFHQDLTGRENIYLNASVLGLNREQTEGLFDEIVAFSELGRFIDMPVKHYSSGMYMRLGFSVAIHVRPDILIVDEILAVGDQTFQAKCIDRIMEMKRAGGLEMGMVEGPGVVRYTIDRLPFLPGRYQLSAAIHDSGHPLAYDYHEEAYAFRIVEGGTAEREGFLALDAAWEWYSLPVDESLQMAYSPAEPA